MKKREISASGKITNEGKLAIYMGEINDFFAQHKNANIIARFIVTNPGTSEALKGYYFNAVVPAMRRAIWESGDRKTEADTEKFLRELSPIMYLETVDIETGEYSNELRTVADLSNPELIEHIETIKQIAAEEYRVYIDDPNYL